MEEKAREREVSAEKEMERAYIGFEVVVGFEVDFISHDAAETAASDF